MFENACHSLEGSFLALSKPILKLGSFGCNFFSSELVKTFGKSNTDQMRTAYCKPVRVDPDRNTVYR